LYLKSSILIGNILVSFFCAGVSGIVLFAEWPSIFAVQQMNPSDFQWILSIFIIYMIYSFYTNLLREIVKDIEDLEGDKNHNIHTLATYFGIQKAKYFTFILTIIFMLAFAVWIIVDPYILTPLLQLLFSILVFLPLVGFAYLLSVSKAQKDFKLLSRYAKFMMAIGVFLLIIIQYAHG
jgi:4-hydroxybenzoate polyprenyltransferase